MHYAQSDDFVQSSYFERPLSARGQEDAAHMLHWFHAHGYHRKALWSQLQSLQPKPMTY